MNMSQVVSTNDQHVITGHQLDIIDNGIQVSKWLVAAEELRH